MAQPRGLIREIVKNFINSFKVLGRRQEHVGTDHLGGKYFESPNPRPGSSYKTSRWFMPPRDNFEHDVPVEWRSWLNHKRSDPPTPEEIQANLERMREIVEKAKNLDKPKTVAVEEVTSEKVAFPTYEDMESRPGSLKNRSQS